MAANRNHYPHQRQAQTPTTKARATEVPVIAVSDAHADDPVDRDVLKAEVHEDARTVIRLLNDRTVKALHRKRNLAIVGVADPIQERRVKAAVITEASSRIARAANLTLVDNVPQLPNEKQHAIGVAGNPKANLTAVNADGLFPLS